MIIFMTCLKVKITMVYFRMNLTKKYEKKIKKTIQLLEGTPYHLLDTNTPLLKEAFDIAYENRLFTLYKYEPTVQDKFKRILFSKLTPISGNLSFLAIQILAANSIMKKNNFARKERYFKKKCGIAINHLRANKTIVEAIKTEDGYKLNGTLTWASGYKIFDHLLIGFHFENKEYEVIARFQKAQGFTILDAPETFVGFGLNTVNIKLNNFFVEKANIVSSNSIGNYTRNKSLSKTVHYALYGLGLGAIDAIENETLKKESTKRLKKIKKAFNTATCGEELDRLRIELFITVQEMVTTGMILNGGKSILIEKRLQQYYRELIMFNSNGLNDTIKNLFLTRSISN